MSYDNLENNQAILKIFRTANNKNKIIKIKIMQKQKIIVGIIVIIVVAVVAAAGLFAYQYFTKPQTPNTETADWKTYKNDECGIEFKYPQNYEITIETKKGAAGDFTGDACFIGLKPIGYAKADDYFLNIGVRPVGFDEMAGILAFEKKNNVWMSVGGQAIPSEAENINMNNMNGLKVDRLCGAGVGKGLVECMVAFLTSDNANSVHFEISPLGETPSISENIFNQVISTFKFTK